MNDFDEIYKVLDSSSTTYLDEKNGYVDKISKLFETIRMTNIDNPDISYKYDLDSNFEDYRIDEVSTTYELDSYAVDYKLKILQDYVKELFAEKNFLTYKKEKELALTKEEYMNYKKDDSIKMELIQNWYKEFIEK